MTSVVTMQSDEKVSLWPLLGVYQRQLNAWEEKGALQERTEIDTFLGLVFPRYSAA